MAGSTILGMSSSAIGALSRRKKTGDLDAQAHAEPVGPPSEDQENHRLGSGHRDVKTVAQVGARRRRLIFRVPQELAKLDRYDLLILDDLSYVRRERPETSVRYELIAERYEHKSLAITVNTPFSQWGERPRCPRRAYRSDPGEDLRR